jgi:hypothetical protein
LGLDVGRIRAPSREKVALFISVPGWGHMNTQIRYERGKHVSPRGRKASWSLITGVEDGSLRKYQVTLRVSSCHPWVVDFLHLHL